MAVMVVTGRLGKDAESRETQGGMQVCQFSVADDIGYGEKKSTQWVKATLFGKRAATLAPHLTKGSIVEVTGTPTIEVWADKNSKEPRGTIALNVLDVRLHGGGRKNESDDKPVADRGRATRGNDIDDSGAIPF